MTSSPPPQTPPSAAMQTGPSGLVGISVIVAVLLTAALTLVDSRDGFSWLTIVACAVSSAALVVGAWCAPPTPVLGRRTWRTGDGQVKTVQLIGGAMVAGLACWMFTLNVGLSALAGIVAALMIGTLWPRPTAADEER